MSESAQIAEIPISSMTPDQATAKLAEMTAAYRGPLPDDPQSNLKRFTADFEKGRKLEAGDIAARREFDALVKAAAEAKPVDVAMSGVLPDAPTSEQRLMSGTADMLRELGIRDEVIREVLNEDEVTQAEQDATRQWRKDHLSDHEYVKRWLAGGEKEKREMMLVAIILSAGIKGKKGF